MNKKRQKAYVAKRKAPITNEVHLDARTPIPFETVDSLFSSLNNTEYLPFMGDDDNYGKKLLEASLNSTTNFACINTKKNYYAGVGFQDASQKELDKKILDWFKSMNLKNENQVALAEAISESFLKFGNCPIELVRFTSGTDKELYIYVRNFLECRLAKPDDNDIVRKVVISKLFKNSSYSSSSLKGARTIPIYDPRNEDKSWFKDENGTERTMIWYRNPISGIDHYGLPSNVASLIYQVLEYKGARYNLDNFENNMVVDAIMVLKGSLSQDEADVLSKKVVRNHTGDGKRGRVVVLASEEGIDGMEIKSLDTKKDGSFNEADDKWMQKIILANDWDATLAGLVSPSTMGKGAGFLTKIIENKMNTVVKPAQRKMMESVWNPIFKIAEDWLKLPFSNYTLEFKNEIDISGLTDVDMTPAVQINEVRKAKGLPEDPTKNGEYLKANNTKGGSNVQDQ